MGEGKKENPSVVPKLETRDLLHYYVYPILQSKPDSGSAKTCEFSREFTVVSAVSTGRDKEADSK